MADARSERTTDHAEAGWRAMTLWIKNIGASKDGLKNKWYDEGSREGEFRWFVRFSTQFPGQNIEKGAFLLYHAFIEKRPAGHLCGVARVSSDKPEWAPRTEDDQWPWKRTTTPLLVLPLAVQGPTLAEIGIDHPPMGGYKDIQPAPFAAAIRLMARNALPSDLVHLVPNP
jgi:hypothetical protein